MSQRKHKKALLEGLTPQFPKNIRELNLASDAVMNHYDLEKVCSSVGKIKSIEKLTTSDRYGWFRAFGIETSEGFVTVAFPWAQDWDKANGVQSDRSIAFYADEAISKDCIDNLALQLIKAFKN